MVVGVGWLVGWLAGWLAGWFGGERGLTAACIRARMTQQSTARENCSPAAPRQLMAWRFPTRALLERERAWLHRTHHLHHRNHRGRCAAAGKEEQEEQRPQEQRSSRNNKSSRSRSSSRGSRNRGSSSNNRISSNTMSKQQQQDCSESCHTTGKWARRKSFSNSSSKRQPSAAEPASELCPPLHRQRRRCKSS